MIANSLSYLNKSEQKTVLPRPPLCCAVLYCNQINILLQRSVRWHLEGTLLGQQRALCLEFKFPMPLCGGDSWEWKQQRAQESERGVVNSRGTSL